MVFRLWTGLWTAFFLLMFVFFNLSFLVKFITRFTEECFASLVAIVFIIDAFKMTHKLKSAEATNSNLTSTHWDSRKENDLAKNEAVFYFSLILFIMTLVICVVLKSFRNKTFLPTKVKPRD